MPPKPESKRPAPNAYDHLWSLLPVFIVFVAVIAVIVVADLGPDPTAQGGAAVRTAAK